MNTASYLHPCYAPAAVLERKIHDIEFFRRRSWITEGEIRSYAKTHGLFLDEERLKRALTFKKITPENEFQHMLKSLERGEWAYPVSIVRAFAEKHRLHLDGATKQMLNRREEETHQLTANYPSVLSAVHKLNELLLAAERGGKRAPKEQHIRDQAAKYSLPLDETRMTEIFG